MTETLHTETADRIRTLTLHRPDARNALNGDLLRAFTAALREADADVGVDAVVVTGADPAFCAGLDLKAIAAGELDFTEEEDDPGTALREIDVPTIAAVNGAAITGGLEIVLGCSFAIASERARFADTHARVGIHPGWGLTGLLPQFVGYPRAREMSFTGNFVDADEALRIGLVNRVVAHDELLDVARAIAADIVSNDRRAVRAINATYRDVAEMDLADGYALERRRAREMRPDPEVVAERRAGVTERGRSQVG